MPLISVHMVTGRPAEAKQRMLKAISAVAAETLGVPLQTVRVFIVEVPPDQFAVGGVLKSESGEAAGG